MDEKSEIKKECYYCLKPADKLFYAIPVCSDCIKKVLEKLNDEISPVFETTINYPDRQSGEIWRGIYLLQNEKEFVEFCKKIDNYNCGKEEISQESYQGFSGFINHPPLHYPCYVYLTVRNWVNEEEDVNYLYSSDVRLMLSLLDSSESLKRKKEHEKT